MKFIDGLEQIRKPFPNAVVTIGNFDGVHIGHQALFHEVIEKADEIQGTSVAVTFEPHPLRVLSPNGHPPLITPYAQKRELIEKTGIEILICIPFTRAFAEITACEFLEEILVHKVGMKAILVGKDYSFGRNREGNVALLQRLAKPLGYEVLVSDWIPVNHQVPGRISSTRIREAVMAGNVAEVYPMLGRNFQIRGDVVPGRNRGGRLLGFPTANIRVSNELCPKAGVYAVLVELDGRNYRGVANIGYSPTFNDHLYTVEVHILDFSGNIYGHRVRMNFISRIRDEIKFSDLRSLSQQIQIDAALARELVIL